MWRGTSGEAVVVIESFTPIVITTWYGTVDRDLIDRAFDRLETLYEAASIRVAISNVVELETMPPASERRQMAERTERLAKSMPNDHASIVVMQSSVRRARLTAVQWLTRSTNRMESSATIHDAFLGGGPRSIARV